MLNADFVSIAVPGCGHKPIFKLGRAGLKVPPATLIRILRRRRTTSDSGRDFVVAGGSRGGNLHVMTAPIDFGADASLAAASARETFPTKEERLLLNTGGRSGGDRLPAMAWSCRTPTVYGRGGANDRLYWDRRSERQGPIYQPGRPATGRTCPPRSCASARGRRFRFAEVRTTMRDDIWPSVLRTGRWKGHLALQHFGSGADISFLIDSFRIDDPRTRRTDERRNG